MTSDGRATPGGGKHPHPVLRRYYDTLERRPAFVQDLFDDTAPQYDRINRVLSFGSGGWYRRDVLRRAGLARGMRVLDVAVGTGLVAAEAVRLSPGPGDVLGLDVSLGMLREARRKLSAPLVQGRAEALPFADGCFDMLTMGYALRHVADLGQTFAEYRRVLRPGGRLVVLEIGRPENGAAARAVGWYVGRVVPFLFGLVTGREAARTLMRYYADTIAQCVEPAVILRSLTEAGFADAGCQVTGGIFRNYLACKPG